jgi:hypothetical protein
MNARFVTAATLSIAFSAVVLPAKAADPQLLNLVMPDAKVLAGVNVDQAKTSPFGQYVLSQLQSNNQDMQKLVTLTGFDPTLDVGELLVASNGTPNTGLAMARGNFDAAKIAAVATAHGAGTEAYGGATIIKDPKNTHGVAFLSASLVVAGDLANVKAAIDRQKVPAPFSAALAVQVSQWSTTEDAWGVSAVPPSSLHPSPNAPKVPGLNGQGAFQSIQSMAGGVKFGSLVVVKGQAVADNAQDATQMGDALKLLASLAQMQAQKEPAAAALAQSLQVTTQGSTLNVQVSLPEDQLQEIVKPRPNIRRNERALRPM